jgi:hypothetical protein
VPSSPRWWPRCWRARGGGGAVVADRARRGGGRGAGWGPDEVASGMRGIALVVIAATACQRSPRTSITPPAPGATTPSQAQTQTDRMSQAQIDRVRAEQLQLLRTWMKADPIRTVTELGVSVDDFDKLARTLYSKPIPRLSRLLRQLRFISRLRPELLSLLSCTAMRAGGATNPTGMTGKTASSRKRRATKTAPNMFAGTRFPVPRTWRSKNALTS